ncbi:MAG: QueT transporter family protein [Lysinibacillus sp.]
MKVQFLAASAIVAALYVAITMLVAPISFGQVQFRIAEMFNHLVAFDARFAIGVTLGVLISNALFSNVGPIDLIFGVGHTIVTLAIFIFICKFVKNMWARLIINSLLFTFTMFIIAFQLNLVLELPFWETWAFVAIGEFVVMMVGVPIMAALNKRLKFDKML